LKHFAGFVYRADLAHTSAIFSVPENDSASEQFTTPFATDAETSAVDTRCKEIMAKI
jgi:hypothetical protein